jgi:hypothetical protein
LATPSGKVDNYCNKRGHFARECWKKKKRNSNFSGNINRGVTHRRDRKVVIVTRCNRKVLAKTNYCCETTAIRRPHDLRKNLHIKSATPRPQSVVSCDPPCRNPSLGRRAVFADVNVSRAGESVDMSQTVDKVREIKIIGNACSEVGRTNNVARSVDSLLQVDHSTREIRTVPRYRAWDWKKPRGQYSH